MRGFGRYSVLNQAHQSARARDAAIKDWRGVARDAVERRSERHERDKPIQTAERATARPLVVQTFNLEPSRPMQADAWSKVLPNGPAPGESTGHYVWRREVLSRRILEQEKATRTEANAIPRAMRTETNPVRRNKEIQAILDRRAMEAEAKKALRSKTKDAGKGAEINDD